MPDDPSSKSSIPSWQEKAQADLTDSSKSPESGVVPSRTEGAGAEESTSESAVDKTSALHEQAAKFLQEPTIANASEERKIQFLRSKGVSEDTITELRPSMQPRVTATNESNEQSSTQPPTQPPAPASPRDVPPVITYPEFLMHSQQPAPLITASRLLYTTYFTGGLVAAFYGLSKYIVGPMTANLTEARHDFATHTQTHVQELNSQMSKIVSTVPTGPKTQPQDSADNYSEISGADSDPTELYHRDFGTQTSPNLSRRESMAEVNHASDASEPGAVAESHQRRLEIMRSHISELLDDGTREDSTVEDGKMRVKELSQYLDSLTYPTLDYANYNYDGMYSVGQASNKKKDDAIEAVKKEIRSVKGVLLSARNFPSTAA
ncbi:MAG: hypothetical protein M1820_010304 [Bogoriella megaspora]|nr:MAG: hypothetical protein M1820_010304 [Bogoriella megaspora]